jgi:bacterioferritin (cytochrome b1)
MRSWKQALARGLFTRWSRHARGGIRRRSCEQYPRIVHSISPRVSREIFRSILGSEEEHIDFLETQLDLIDRIGIENYCQSQMSEGSES